MGLGWSSSSTVGNVGHRQPQSAEQLRKHFIQNVQSAVRDGLSTTFVEFATDVFPNVELAEQYLKSKGFTFVKSVPCDGATRYDITLSKERGHGGEE
jgi:hypothetical protein